VQYAHHYVSTPESFDDAALSMLCNGKLTGILVEACYMKS
jgi:hypothetical protein